LKQIILASTSTLPDEPFLDYLLDTLSEFYKNIKTVTFIPYARPGGISHDHYTRHVSVALSKIGKKVVGLHSFENPEEGLAQAEALFTGGGNTFVLVKTLHELGIMDLLSSKIKGGTPYLGCSAASNIAGVNMQTTNDMPIVMPKSFQTMGLIPFNINAHYMDPIPGIKHQGESRETRIKEFHHFQATPVLGLREGSYVYVHGADISLEGGLLAKLFQKDEKALEISELPASLSRFM